MYLKFVYNILLNCIRQGTVERDVLDSNNGNIVSDELNIYLSIDN